MANTTTGTEKAKEKGQKDIIGIDDIGIFEFIFYGLPEPPELEGIDEDRLRELQNVVQEQLLCCSSVVVVPFKFKSLY